MRRNSRAMFRRVVTVLCIIVIFYCGVQLSNYYRQNAQNEKMMEELRTEAFVDSKEDSIDYDALLGINSDCVGWIKVLDTVIDYPIVQSEDDDFYLHHDFQKKSKACGSIFLDSRCDIDAKKEHLIIYGHRMKNGSMFDALTEYESKDFYKKNPTFTLYLRDQKYTCEVAAVYKTTIDKNEAYYDYIKADTREDQLAYIANQMKPMYQTGVEIGEDDEIVSLSTCEYTKANGRLIVLAKRVKDK